MAGVRPAVPWPVGVHLQPTGDVWRLWALPPWGNGPGYRYVWRPSAQTYADLAGHPLFTLSRVTVPLSEFRTDAHQYLARYGPTPWPPGCRICGQGYREPIHRMTTGLWRKDTGWGSPPSEVRRQVLTIVEPVPPDWAATGW